MRATASGVSGPPSAAKARPSAARSPAPCARGWAAMICSASVVPERGMPTMKTGRCCWLWLCLGRSGVSFQLH